MALGFFPSYRFAAGNPDQDTEAETSPANRDWDTQHARDEDNRRGHPRIRFPPGSNPDMIVTFCHDEPVKVGGVETSGDGFYFGGPSLTAPATSFGTGSSSFLLRNGTSNPAEKRTVTARHSPHDVII